jgi:hypothetical protein
MSRTESPQPVDKKGIKNVECPYYSECLMHAAKHNWNVWTCAKCPNLELDSVCKKLKFILPYYELLSQIYPEFRRKYEPVIDLFDLEH